MSEKPLTVWCVSDGRAGIERQTVAVANALSELAAIDMRMVHLTPTGPQTWLPPQFWPFALVALPGAQKAALAPPLPAMWPDVWIANGRRSIPYSLRAKALSGRKSLIVQLQDPRVNPSRFDLVVPPRHDGVVGANVVSTLGAPVWFTAAQIEAARATIPAICNMQARKVLVVLGGPSKRHRFSVERAQAIVRDLVQIATPGTHLMITTSRRTPDEVAALFRDFASGYNASFFANEQTDGPNPYLAWLASADCVLVTEDSTNMMTDAAFFGLPIHLVKLEGGDARFDLLHQGFMQAGAARWFSGSLGSWTYPPIKDALDVAHAIVSRLTSATT